MMEVMGNVGLTARRPVEESIFENGHEEVFKQGMVVPMVR